MNTQTIKLLLIGVIISLYSLSSCKIGFDCTLVDGMPEFNDLVSVENAAVVPLYLDAKATFGDDYKTQELVINDSITYQHWVAIADSMDCNYCNFPYIDFAKNSLVGKYYLLKCTEVPLVKIVQDGNTYRHITKKVDNTQCLSAGCDNETMAWIILPKLDTAAVIIYESGESHYDCEGC